ncbi:MAG: hypothetical protein V7K40_32380 [Nostoc sp.]|uniref:nucleotide-binding protein n=1 Tax=Nostoc sp. TaxID=1180 RepID=UPI002FF4DFA0
MGKTSLSIHLEVAAAIKGKETVLVDLDPQASASKWGDSREAESPVVISCGCVAKICKGRKLCINQNQLSSYSENLSSKFHLSSDVCFFNSFNLSFANHVHCFISP